MSAVSGCCLLGLCASFHWHTVCVVQMSGWSVSTTTSAPMISLDVLTNPPKRVTVESALSQWSRVCGKDTRHTRWETPRQRRRRRRGYVTRASRADVKGCRADAKGCRADAKGCRADVTCTSTVRASATRRSGGTCALTDHSGRRGGEGRRPTKVRERTPLPAWRVIPSKSAGVRTEVPFQAGGGHRRRAHDRNQPAHRPLHGRVLRHMPRPRPPPQRRRLRAP
eukprot:1195078-Prorocentrum_minimum.AAC.2